MTRECFSLSLRLASGFQKGRRREASCPRGSAPDLIFPLFCTYRSFQHIQELRDSRFFLPRRIALPPKESRIKLLDQQSVLESFCDPVENRHHHFNVKIAAEFSSLKT